MMNITIENDSEHRKNDKCNKFLLKVFSEVLLKPSVAISFQDTRAFILVSREQF